MSEETNPPAEARPTIFLIEEDDDVRPLLRNSLRQSGYRLLIAADLEDAFEWVQSTHIPADLVLINLVGKSAEEALRIGRAVRARSKYDGHTPLIVLPDKVAEELAGTDVNVDGHDWVCYYEDGEQVRRLIARLTDRDMT